MFRHCLLNPSGLTQEPFLIWIIHQHATVGAPIGSVENDQANGGGFGVRDLGASRIGAAV